MILDTRLPTFYLFVLFGAVFTIRPSAVEQHPDSFPKTTVTIFGHTLTTHSCFPTTFIWYEIQYNAIINDKFQQGCSIKFTFFFRFWNTVNFLSFGHYVVFSSISDIIFELNNPFSELTFWNVGARNILRCFQRVRDLKVYFRISNFKYLHTIQHTCAEIDSLSIVHHRCETRRSP